MSNQLCFQCFRIKGDYEVCPYCGHVEVTRAKEAYQLAPGTVLKDRYIIGTCIGFGGFGITYKAYDTVLSIVVAIKEFYPAGLVNRGEGEKKVGIFSGDKKTEFDRQLKRFLEEAKHMAIFSKEKDIVNVFDYFEDNQTAYIIMEYIEGELLKDRLKNGKMKVQTAVGYMTAILNALEKIHRQGIIHKDVSPDNIFLTGENTIKLFDFGAAKFQGTESERSEDVVIKAGYTPPEQYRSKSEQGIFMDIYAAGAVFYEMVTGVRPVEAPDRAVEDILELPGKLGIPIDENLEHIIMKAVALKPELRFQTAEQFKEAIIMQKRVELPEEEMKKIQQRKKWIGISSVAVIAIVAVMMILSQTVFSGRGKIDVAKIGKETVDVWLVQENDEGGKKVKQALQEGVSKKCPQLKVNIKLMDEKEYQKKIREAKKTGKFPDVFCTDSLDEKKYCGELSRLLRTMDLEDYLYLKGIQETEKNVYGLPSSVQVGVLYVNKSKQKDIPKSVHLTQLSKKGQEMKYANGEKAYLEFQNSKSEVSWLVGDISDLEEVKKVTIDQVPPIDFSVIPILEKRKLIGCYGHTYGVSNKTSQDEQDAAMYVLSMLLSENVQSALYMNNEEGIPVNRQIYADFKEYKMTTYLSFLKKYEPEEIEIRKETDIYKILKEQSER